MSDTPDSLACQDLVPDERLPGQDVRRRVEFQKILSGLSATFINLSPELVDREIMKGLETFGKALSADRATLGQISPSSGDLLITHTWAQPGFPAFGERVLKGTLPWLEQRIRRGETTSAERPEALPPDAHSERQYMQAQGLKSSLVAPFRVGGKVIGAMSIDCFRNYRHWDADTVSQMQDVANIFANALARKLANVNSPFHTVILVCLVVLLSYFASRVGATIVLRPQMVWPLWPCNVLLASVLVLVQRRIWPIILASGFATYVLFDLHEGVPIRSIGLLILSDAVEVLTAASCLSYFFDGVPRLDSVKALAKYSLFAVILAPLAGAFFGALPTSGNYWTHWTISFFSEAIGFLVLMPAILGWIGGIQAWKPKPRAFYLELTVLLGVMILFAYFTFAAVGRSTDPALLYSLVPFLLWSALRFGTTGTSTSLIPVGYLMVWGAAHGRGPFIELGPIKSVFSLQLFLFFTAVPFMVLAALIEERKRAEEESREAQRLAHVGNWLVDQKSGAITWSEETYRIHGFDPKLPQPSHQEISRMFTPDSWTRLSAALNEGFRSGLFPEMDLELIRPDGSKRWVADRGEAIRDATGRITQLRGSIQDITDRKRAEQVAQELSTLNHELELARQIQLSILPRGEPKIVGLEIAARYLPMGKVAGDFYDFIVVDEKHLGILIADVSGHGLPAALIASMLQVALAAQVAHAAEPGRVLSGLNQALCGKFQHDFVTAAYVFVDMEKNSMSYAGAGHPPLLVWRSSTRSATDVEENGLILGHFPEVTYSVVHLPLEPGDKAVIYTDGILETKNPSGEMYGIDLFRRFLDSNHSLGANQFVDLLLDELSRWSGKPKGHGQQDDITVLAIDFESHG